MTDFERAEAARGLLANPLLQEAFQVVRAHTVRTWERAAASDTELRERCWYQLHAISEVERFLRIAVERGRVEEMRAQGV